MKQLKHLDREGHGGKKGVYFFWNAVEKIGAQVMALG